MWYVIQAYPGDGVVVLLDAVVGLLQAGSLKWGLTHQQSVPERIQTGERLNGPGWIVWKCAALK